MIAPLWVRLITVLLRYGMCYMPPTLWALKTCHYFDHNSRVSWWISTLCAPIKTGKNTLSGNYKICNVSTTVSLHYRRKFKNTKQHDHGRPLPALHSIEPVVHNLRRNLSSVCRFQFLLWYSLNSLLAENLLHSHRFIIKILSSKLNIRPIIHLHSKHS